VPCGIPSADAARGGEKVVTDQSGPAGDDRGLRPDELVEQLAPGPGQPPDVIAMVGLLGPGSQAGRWRLYLSMAFDTYVEFADDDVVQSRKIETSSIGGTVVWLKRGAAVHLTSTQQADEQASFLQGDVTARFLPGAASSGLGGITPTMRAAGTWSNTRCDFCSFMCCATFA